MKKLIQHAGAAINSMKNGVEKIGDAVTSFLEKNEQTWLLATLGAHPEGGDYIASRLAAIELNKWQETGKLKHLSNHFRYSGADPAVVNIAMAGYAATDAYKKKQHVRYVNRHEH